MAVRKLYRDEQRRAAAPVRSGPTLGQRLRELLAPRPRLAMGLAALLLLLAAAFLLLQAPGLTGAQLQAGLAEGTIEVHSPESGRWTTLTAGGQLVEGEAVRTGLASTAVFRLPGESVVQLEEQSELVIRELETLEDGRNQRIVLEQTRGRTRHRVEPLTADDAVYEVRTPAATIRVVGTAFAVEVAPNDTTTVVVGEGEVQVVAQGRAVTVRPGESVAVAAGLAPFGLVEVGPAQIQSTEPLVTLDPLSTPTSRAGLTDEEPLQPTPTLRVTDVAVQDAAEGGEGKLQDNANGGAGLDNNRPESPPGLEDKEPPPGVTRRPGNDDLPPEGGGERDE